jgi:aspartyl aminopeptidase
MSEFTQHTLRRMTRDEHERSISNSFLVSADMARKCIDCERQSNVVVLSSDAVHPNYSSLHDREHRPSLLNGGVVVKTNCCNRYATTAFTSTLLKEIARLSHVPLQVRFFLGCKQSHTTVLLRQGILHEKRHAMRYNSRSNPVITTRNVHGRRWRASTLHALHP